MARATIKREKKDDLSIPAFLLRGSKEHEELIKRTASLISSGRATQLTASGMEEREAALHAKAAELGFRRGSYQTKWFEDEAWIERVTKLREEIAATHRAALEKRKLNEVPKVKAYRPPKPKSQRAVKRLSSGGNATLVHGRIVVLCKDNPCNEGSKQHAFFESLRAHHGKTVEAYITAHPQAHMTDLLKRHVAKGNVRIASDGDTDEAERETPAPARPEQAEAEQGKGARKRRAPDPAPAEPRGKAAKPGKKAKRGRG